MKFGREWTPRSAGEHSPWWLPNHSLYIRTASRYTSVYIELISALLLHPKLDSSLPLNIYRILNQVSKSYPIMLRTLLLLKHRIRVRENIKILPHLHNTNFNNIQININTPAHFHRQTITRINNKLVTIH